MIYKKAPASAGVTGLILTVPVYGFLQWQFGEIAFLNRMAITFVVVLLVMWIMTIINPLPQPKEMPVRKDFDMKPAPLVKIPLNEGSPNLGAIIHPINTKTADDILPDQIRFF